MKPERLVEQAGDLLETYNWHTISNLPYDLFEELKPFIKKGKALAVAKVIKNKFNFFK